MSVLLQAWTTGLEPSELTPRRSDPLGHRLIDRNVFEQGRRATDREKRIVTAPWSCRRTTLRRPVLAVIWGGMREKTIRIVGFDPGLRRTGWGVIESDGVRLAYVASGHVVSTPEECLAVRLKEIFAGLQDVLRRTVPEEAAVEETFVNENARATLKLGQARGMALLAPALLGLRVAEYPPNLIKKTVVGVGLADKRQVQAMVGVLLPKARFENADEADALAIAICHASHRGVQNRIVAAAGREQKGERVNAKAERAGGSNRLSRLNRSTGDNR
jgi:crossover junction endodeoxyribonuclease RuvC